MSCDHDCNKPPVFPKLIDNRPGLPMIDYRIGAFAELRDYMFDAINKEPALFNWTHRGVDDPGIALIESAAIVGDILTFYQNLYANETYLRTAKWRESITELVRFLGYRLTPALGGDAIFALTVKGTDPVTVPKSFGFKAQLEEQSKPAEFESIEENTAYPYLSQFNLYRPIQNPGPNIAPGINEFSLSLLDGENPMIKLKANDRLLVGVPQFDVTNPIPVIGVSPPEEIKPLHLTNMEIVIVKETRQEFGRLIVTLKGAIAKNSGTQLLMAYKLGDSHRHFGHNAPPKTIGLNTSTTPPTLTSSSVDYTRLSIGFRGYWYYPDADESYYEIDPSVTGFEFPLDSEVKSVGAGDTILIDATLDLYNDIWVPADSTERVTLIGKVAGTENRSMTLGNLSSSATVLTLEYTLDMMANLFFSSVGLYLETDIRSMSIYETQSEAMIFQVRPTYVTATSGQQLDFYGTAEQVSKLENRNLMFTYSDGTTAIVNVTGLGATSLDEPDKLRQRTIFIDTEVDYTKFLYDDLQVTVYGNLIPATQGKTEDQVVLGSGDQRQIFQTFAVPKNPLTFLLDETQTPAQVPELTIYIDNIEWQRVDTFFNSGPNDKVYVVRSDAEGKSYVQFGDGITGARLNSGKNNVVAIFRTGSEAYGPLKTNTKAQAKSRLANLDKVYMPAPATGGAAAEDENNARVAAPGKIQSLGRLVSLADFETEALAIPNVIKVKAGWAIFEGLPLVRLVVLTQSGDAADTVAINDTMQTYNICRGPARFPIQVIQGVRQFIHINLVAGFEPDRREEDMIIAIKLALGLSGEEGNGIDNKDGLFGLNHRQFGQGVHSSQIIAAVQQVPGVVWAELNKDQLINLGIPPETDPTVLSIPASPIFNNVLACDEDRILVLHSAHFIVSLSKVETPQACDA